MYNLVPTLFLKHELTFGYDLMSSDILELKEVTSLRNHMTRLRRRKLHNKQLSKSCHGGFSKKLIDLT